MKKQLGIPQYWQDFEDLCHELWKALWIDPNAQKNGRPGQEQHGVDIYGTPYRKNGYYGVQCKGKIRNYEKKLTVDELDNEARDAMKFKPKLQHFIMATTSPSDTRVQEKARQLTDSNVYGYPISVWSWDEISNELQARPEVYKKVYNEDLDESLIPHSIIINYTDREDRVFTFLSRPMIVMNTSQSFRDIFGLLLCELIDNFFRHSHASYVKVSFDNYAFSLEYDGDSFDPTVLLKSNGDTGGTTTLHGFIDFCKDGVSLSYESNDGKNIYTMIFQPDCLKKELEFVEIEIPKVNIAFCRTDGENQSSIDINRYKKQGKKVKLLIKSMSTISGTIHYIDEWIRRAPELIESVSFPDQMVADRYESELDRLNIKYNVR